MIVARKHVVLCSFFASQGGFEAVEGQEEASTSTWEAKHGKKRLPATVKGQVLVVGGGRRTDYVQSRGEASACRGSSAGLLVGTVRTIRYCRHVCKEKRWKSWEIGVFGPDVASRSPRIFRHAS